MNVYEMEGFLRGQCVPRDLLVNESNAAYLVRKLREISSVKAERDAQQKRADALAVENAEMRSVIDAAIGVANNSSGIAGWHLNGEIADWDEILPELNIETPATSAALAAIRTESHIAGIEAAANRVGVISLQYKAGQKQELIRAIGRAVFQYATKLREAK